MDEQEEYKVIAANFKRHARNGYGAWEVVVEDKDGNTCTVMRGDVMTAERDATAALKDRVEKTKRSKK